MLKFEAKRRFCKNLAKTGGLHPPGSAAHAFRLGVGGVGNVSLRVLA